MSADILSLDACATLHNGVRMPWFGLGTWQSQEGDEVRDAVAAALKHGYRHIDTAAAYGNECGVGEALRDSGAGRDDVFVTTKLWNNDAGYDNALRAIDESLSRLGLEHVDLYLIHWPVADRRGHYRDSWRALEKIYADGRARAIGVSNFNIHHLETLAERANVMPMVNQCEFHPRLVQRELRDYCAKHDILFEGWSPLMRGEVLDIAEVQSIAERHGKSPAQVALRWALQHGVVTIPKSTHEDRIRHNADLFDFDLSDDAMRAIDALDQHRRLGPDPDTFTH